MGDRCYLKEDFPGSASDVCNVNSTKYNELCHKRYRERKLQIVEKEKHDDVSMFYVIVQIIPFIVLRFKNGNNFLQYTKPNVKVFGEYNKANIGL